METWTNIFNKNTHDFSDGFTNPKGNFTLAQRTEDAIKGHVEDYYNKDADNWEVMPESQEAYNLHKSEIQALKTFTEKAANTYIDTYTQKESLKKLAGKLIKLIDVCNDLIEG